MTEYEEFKGAVLYELARRDGFRTLEHVRGDHKALDAIDFHLHLRKLQDERLIERGVTKGSVGLEILATRTPPQKYVELAPAGWAWVRKHREAEKSNPKRSIMSGLK